MSIEGPGFPFSIGKISTNISIFPCCEQRKISA